MYQLSAIIRFGDWEIYKVVEVSIEKSWKFLTSTAKITLPRRAFPDGDLNNWKNKDGTAILKVGTPVHIQLGYDFEFQSEFIGYIAKIGTETPITIECEDGMWLLKQTKIKKSYAAVSLSQLLADIIPNSVKYQTSGEVQLGRFYIDSASVFQVLDRLSDDYGLYSYFRNDVLFVGFAYDNPQFRTVKLDLRQQVASIQSLAYRTKDDIKIQVRAISMQPNGTKIEKTLGDEGGELHTLHLPIGLNEGDLEKQALAKIELFRFDGYDGDITTFGRPFLEHGDIVEPRDDQYPEREGSYRIDGVKIEFGVGGYRRHLSIGKKTN